MSKSERRVGTVSRGIRCPIIREGDDLSVIVTDSVLKTAESEGFELRDRDVIAVTETGSRSASEASRWALKKSF